VEIVYVPGVSNASYPFAVIDIATQCERLRVQLREDRQGNSTVFPAFVVDNEQVVSYQGKPETLPSSLERRFGGVPRNHLFVNVPVALVAYRLACVAE
jgi:hypothetical protein